MAIKIESSKSSLSNNIIIALFLAMTIWGICLISISKYILKGTLVAEGLDKTIIDLICKQFTTIYTVFTMAALVIVIFIGWSLSKKITKTINKLTEGVMEVARGNLDVQIDIPNCVEFGPLATSFKKMTEDLKSTTTSIDNLNKEIAERKQAELKQNELRKKAELIYKVVPSAIFTVDKNRKIMSWNNKAEELTGYTTEEVIGKECSILSFEPCCHECNLFSDDTEKPILYRECTLKRKDGRIRIISKNVDLLEDENENIIGGIESFEDITERKQAQAELQSAQEKLIESAHRAGMAEVATGVLHNVGNVLNSVRTNAESIQKNVRNSKVSYLADATTLLKEHTDDISKFLTTTEQGKKLPAFLSILSEELITEQKRYLKALKTLTKHIKHMADIIHLQQSYSKTAGLIEPASITELVEDSIQINAQSLKRHNVKVKREFIKLPPLLIDSHKVLQILTNLISNAKYAMSDNNRNDKILTIRITEPQDERFRIEVHDNGTGIAKENLTRIFEHGFTTKKNGFGFGLHSAAIAANEMNGSLSAHSDGPGKGTVLILELPFQTKEVEK
jgi:PAS domain S-box-containing protein